MVYPSDDEIVGFLKVGRPVTVAQIREALIEDSNVRRASSWLTHRLRSLRGRGVRQVTNGMRREWTARAAE